jgi:hypothetical protein
MALLVNSVPLYRPGLAALDEQPIELAGDPDARDRVIGNQCQALAGAAIDDHQDAQRAAADRR